MLPSDVTTIDGEREEKLEVPPALRPKSRRYVMAAEALVPRAARTRSVARWLALSMVAFLVFAMLAPWQQSVSGTGRVIAYAPVERRQPLEAPVAGRIVRWWVREGTLVDEGDPIVEITDNDPMLLQRLALEKEAAQMKLSSYEERLATLDLQIRSAELGRRSDIDAAEAKLRASIEKLKGAEQKLEAAEAALETAMLNNARVKALTERGLSAQRDLELAELGERKARTDRDGAEADARAAIGDVDTARANLEKARADGDAKVQDSQAKLRSGQSDVADARASLQRLQVTIARQENQIVRAPRRGIVLSVVAAQGGKQVKQGDMLAMLVPETRDRALELYVDGNDAALVGQGRHVRVQFEGWPAIQFAGWPSVAVGTFGGTVSFVDPHDDGYGNFRVVIVPDETTDAWPEPRFLRQGVRAKGWILLEEVRVGFELWRRFNGFPPVLREPPKDLGPPSTGEKAAEK